MNGNDFSVGGVLASSVGLIATTRPLYARPAERVTTYPLPRMGGTAWRREVDEHGEPLYEEANYAIGCLLKRGASLDAAMAMLGGGGRLQMGWIADSVFDARVDGAILTETVVDGDDTGYRELTINYACQPLRWHESDPAIQIVTAGEVVTASLAIPYTESSSPLVVVTGTGDAALTIGGWSVILTGIVDGIVIDGIDREMYGATGRMRDKVTGDYPWFAPGAAGRALTVGFAGSAMDVSVRTRQRRA